jgi:putative redox protein
VDRETCQQSSRDSEGDPQTALALLYKVQMRSCTRHLDGKRFETIVGRHRIITDQPVSAGGTDGGPTPPELLLASLGACAGHYAVEYLCARSLPLSGLEISVLAQKATNPTRLASFCVEVGLPGIGERHKQGLLRAVKACLIHNTLEAGPVIEVEVSVSDSLCQSS